MPDTYFDTFVRAVDACPDKSGILGDEYLVFPPREDYGYAATPKNALTFGTMGVDGVHYAILKLDGGIRDDSPVIQIVPMDPSDPYSLLGDSLLEYFALACGVSTSEMENVFAQERDGKTVLVEFMKQHFDQSRLFDQDSRAEMAHIIELIESTPW